jgi:hypothetical protein
MIKRSDIETFDVGFESINKYWNKLSENEKIEFANKFGGQKFLEFIVKIEIELWKLME